jgi:hypothetical protein
VHPSERGQHHVRLLQPGLHVCQRRFRAVVQIPLPPGRVEARDQDAPLTQMDGLEDTLKESSMIRLTLNGS